MKRREFLGVAVGTVAMAANALTAKSTKAATGESNRVPLGLDGHAMRAMKWKAQHFIEFAA
ncbi:MAG: hypothetical protein ACOY3P_21930, partial [Planctomycetota bacterium]